MGKAKVGLLIIYPKVHLTSWSLNILSEYIKMIGVRCRKERNRNTVLHNNT